MQIRDNIHYNCRTIDGYNKPFNCVVSAREAGKSTTEIVDKVYKEWCRGFLSIFLRRKICDITDLYLATIANIIKDFCDDTAKISWTKKDQESGICPLYLNDKLFCIIVAMAVPIDRIKSTKLEKPLAFIMLDEFIVNPKFGEKYLTGEFAKFMEIYNTFRREEDPQKKLKCYLWGNPYTLYNPYFIGFNVNVKKCKVGTILQGNTWVVQNYELHPALKEKLKEENPLYDADFEVYKNYALEGQAVNDANIRIGTMHNNYELYLNFNIDNNFISVYINRDYVVDGDTRFYCCKTQESHKQTTYCFSFDNLGGTGVLYKKNKDIRFNIFASAIRQNKVEYDSINTYYLTQEIYYNI